MPRTNLTDEEISATLPQEECGEVNPIIVGGRCTSKVVASSALGRRNYAHQLRQARRSDSDEYVV